MSADTRQLRTASEDFSQAGTDRGLQLDQGSLVNTPTR
jgi:hypothetical protein